MLAWKLYLSDLEQWRIQITGSHVPVDSKITWTLPVSDKERLDEDTRDIIMAFSKKDKRSRNNEIRQVIAQKNSFSSARLVPSTKKIQRFIENKRKRKYIFDQNVRLSFCEDASTTKGLPTDELDNDKNEDNEVKQSVENYDEEDSVDEEAVPDQSFGPTFFDDASSSREPVLNDEQLEPNYVLESAEEQVTTSSSTEADNERKAKQSLDLMKIPTVVSEADNVGGNSAVVFAYVGGEDNPSLCAFYNTSVTEVAHQATQVDLSDNRLQNFGIIKSTSYLPSSSGMSINRHEVGVLSVPMSQSVAMETYPVSQPVTVWSQGHSRVGGPQFIGVDQDGQPCYANLNDVVLLCPQDTTMQQ